MSINLNKLLDIRNFYVNVPYYIDKGGRDGMAELAQQYKTLTKMHRIKIPKIVNLLKAHLDVKYQESSTPRHIKHLEHAAIQLASARSEKLTNQIAKLQMHRLFETEKKMEPEKSKKVGFPTKS